MPKELSLVIFHRVYFATFIEGLCPNGAYTRRLLFLKVHKSSFTEWDVAFSPIFLFFLNENCERKAIKLIEIF